MYVNNYNINYVMFLQVNRTKYSLTLQFSSLPTHQKLPKVNNEIFFFSGFSFLFCLYPKQQQQKKNQKPQQHKKKTNKM